VVAGHFSRIGCFFLVVLFVCGPVCGPAGLCAPLSEHSLEVAKGGEGVLEVRASVAAPSWKNAVELPRLRLFLDDEYCQDILLVPAGDLLTYLTVLGRVDKGTHSLRLEQHGCSAVELQSVSLKTYSRTDEAFSVLAHSPFVYLRSDSVTNCTDIPLLMWHEVLRSGGGTRIRYTVLFSNEDGGTPAPALMARWGRTTDIEWIYAVDFDARGGVASERYQGPGHSAPRFRGEKIGHHPLFAMSTTNNMVSPATEGDVRVGLCPLATLPPDKPREAMMNLNPWTFRIMAEELYREGKIESVASASTIAVSDPRNYLYCDVDCTKLGRAEAAVEVVLEDGRSFRSDHGISLGLSSRHGVRRTAVELPPGTNGADVSRVHAVGVSGSDGNKTQSPAIADRVNVQRCFFLDPDYEPTDPVRLPRNPSDD